MTRKAAPTKKLFLNKRHVRQLDDDALAGVNGGQGTSGCPDPTDPDGGAGGGATHGCNNSASPTLDCTSVAKDACGSTGKRTVAGN